MSFNWSLTANGNIGSPTAYYYVDTTPYGLIGTSGSVSIEIPAGDTIGFELVGNVSPGKSPTQLIITEVPETGNALAGLLVLGAAGFEWFRRKQAVAG